MGLDLDETSLLFIDTAPFIYFFEKHPDYFAPTASVFDQLYEAQAQATTSLITYIEIATGAEKAGAEKTRARYREFFVNSDRLTIQPMNLAIAEMAVNFRAAYNLKTPDAIQLATAVNCGADFVLTNDKDWGVVDEVEVIMLSDL